MENDYLNLLKDILKTSRWTQEQLAAKLGVSFATINSWLNGKSRPRETMLKNIRRLYLAQDLTKETTPTYITLVNIPCELRVEDSIVLEKEQDSDYDDESIRASIFFCDEKQEDRERTLTTYNPMFVANSVDTVFRGTQSAGRIYDKITGTANAKILFIHRNIAIAQITRWN